MPRLAPAFWFRLRAAGRRPFTGAGSVSPLPGTGRDERFDFIRGLAMLLVVVNHIGIPSLYQVVTMEAIGVVTGAEIFVLVSGTILGLIYRPRLERDGWARSMVPVWRRAMKLYLVVVITNLTIYLVQWLVPVIDHAVLTTYTDPASHKVWSLFGEDPAPAQLVYKVLTLQYGASQINVLGLYVVLVAIAPLLLWLLYRGRVVALLVASWGIYALHTLHPVRLLMLQSELAFPALTWQLLFVHGMAAGYHRRALTVALGGQTGRRLMTAAAVLLAAFSFYALNNPWFEIPLSLRFRLIPEHEFGWVYYYFFDRKTLGVGRIANTFLLVGLLYALLTRYWRPCRRILGWLCIPIGMATLYVFIVHVAFVLLLDNMSPLQQKSLVLNTIAHTMVIASLWLMVRTRFLFRWIPR
jgi:hypothetical protein